VPTFFFINLRIYVFWWLTLLRSTCEECHGPIWYIGLWQFSRKYWGPIYRPADSKRINNNVDAVNYAFLMSNNFIFFLIMNYFLVTFHVSLLWAHEFNSDIFFFFTLLNVPSSAYILFLDDKDIFLRDTCFLNRWWADYCWLINNRRRHIRVIYLY